jgi:hypothetical protein
MLLNKNLPNTYAYSVYFVEKQGVRGQKHLKNEENLRDHSAEEKKVFSRPGGMA